MWPWRKREPGPEAASARGEPVPGGPVLRGEWRTLPPIQRVVPEHPLVNPVQRFSGSLASWRSPAYLAPLAHLVAAGEPSGMVEGLARPVAPVSSSAPVDMPVAQRQVRGAKARGSVVQRLFDAVRSSRSAVDAPETPAPEPAAIAEPTTFTEPPVAAEPVAGLESLDDVPVVSAGSEPTHVEPEPVGAEYVEVASPEATGLPAADPQGGSSGSEQVSVDRPVVSAAPVDRPVARVAAVQRTEAASPVSRRVSPVPRESRAVSREVPGGVASEAPPAAVVREIGESPAVSGADHRPTLGETVVQRSVETVADAEPRSSAEVPTGPDEVKPVVARLPEAGVGGAVPAVPEVVRGVEPVAARLSEVGASSRPDDPVAQEPVSAPEVSGPELVVARVADEVVPESSAPLVSERVEPVVARSAESVVPQEIGDSPEMPTVASLDAVVPVVGPGARTARSEPPTTRVGLGMPRVGPVPSVQRNVVEVAEESSGPVLGMASALPVLGESPAAVPSMPGVRADSAPDVAGGASVQRDVEAATSGTTFAQLPEALGVEPGVVRAADVQRSVEPSLAGAADVRRSVGPAASGAVHVRRSVEPGVAGTALVQRSIELGAPGPGVVQREVGAGASGTAFVQREVEVGLVGSAFVQRDVGSSGGQARRVGLGTPMPSAASAAASNPGLNTVPTPGSVPGSTFGLSPASAPVSTPGSAFGSTFGSNAGPAPVSASAGRTSMAFVQRTEAVTPPDVVVSRDASAPSEPVPGPAPDAGTPAVESPAAASAAGASPAGAAQAGAGQEPEKLLEAVYPTLLRRLKAELWLDRERRGVLTDRWH